MRDREQVNAARMRNYRAYRLRLIVVLGGKCVVCGSTDELEIDHKDPSTKLFDPSSHQYISDDLLSAEMAKCQLLCEAHHREKTLKDRGQSPARGTHGTISAYRYCHCDLCRAAKSAWMRDYDVRTGRRPRHPPQPYVHGTRRMYVTKHCRCDLCKLANNTYQRNMMKRRRREMAGVSPCN